MNEDNRAMDATGDHSESMPPGPLQRCAAAGFQYPVFISWPHQIQSRGADIVRALAEALENQFRDEGGAQVLLDLNRLKGGYRWDPVLRKGACRSVVTIAFILRTYFQSEYCRLEWAISESLERVRMPTDADQSLILPIVLAKNMPLPREVRDLHYSEEFQTILASGKDVTTHDKWNGLVCEIVARVYEAIDIVCQSARDWASEEEIAKATQPKRFTWPPPPPGATPPEPHAPRFPRMSVERRAP